MKVYIYMHKFLKIYDKLSSGKWVRAQELLPFLDKENKWVTGYTYLKYLWIKGFLEKKWKGTETFYKITDKGVYVLYKAFKLKNTNVRVIKHLIT